MSRVLMELSKFLREKLPIPTVGDAPHQSFSFKFRKCEFGDSFKRSFQPHKYISESLSQLAQESLNAANVYFCPMSAF